MFLDIPGSSETSDCGLWDGGAAEGAPLGGERASQALRCALCQAARGGLDREALCRLCVPRRKAFMAHPAPSPRQPCPLPLPGQAIL